MKSDIVLALPHKKDNPRNSEGSFVSLKDGRILFAYSRFSGEEGGDHNPAVIAGRYSSDGGRTWTREHRVLVENEGVCNVMSATLLRLASGRIALFYLCKNSALDLRTHVRFSDDEGEHWSASIVCNKAPGYFVCNNDRIIQLQSGRLVMPVGYHRTTLSEAESIWAAIDTRSITLFYLSDDEGATWFEAEDWWAMPEKSGSGLQEPGVVELADGTLYAWARTDSGCQWEMRSNDEGKTWSAPVASRFVAPCAPLSIKRNPSDESLLAVWNDTSLGLPTEDSSWGRTPLAFAISRDEGKRWSDSQLIEDDPACGFCYTAIHFVENAVLLAYCCGGRGSHVLQDMRIRRIEGFSLNCVVESLSP